jgi:cellulose biosynthesis protein BcsQ
VASTALDAGNGAAGPSDGLPAAEFCTTPIHDDPALAESRDAGLDIFRHAPGSAGARDYAALADELRDWL